MSRFYFIKQHDAMQCGPACLAMICRYYGKTYTLSTLSKLCPATNEGVSLLCINNAAEKLGFHTIMNLYHNGNYNLCQCLQKAPGLLEKCLEHYYEHYKKSVILSNNT